MDERKQIAEALREMVNAHNRGDIEKLPDLFNQIEEIYTRTPAATEISISYNFSDSWADAANHEWQYHEGISKDDWPLLGKEIAECLDNEKPINSEKILKNFKLV